MYFTLNDNTVYLEHYTGIVKYDTPVSLVLQAIRISKFILTPT
jgi:hypothetical protein